MNDKPTGPAEAAREIDKLQEEWFTTRLAGEDMPHPDERVPTIEAIILKHRSEDKAGKLVEALIEARVVLGFPLGTQPNEFFSIKYHAVADTVKIIDSALADYEKVKE